MKELRSKYSIKNRGSITFIAILIISMFALLKNVLNSGQIIIFVIITSIINYITSFNLYNNFSVEEGYLLISNNWNPLINLKIYYSEITKIESKVANQMGLSILISYANGRKRFFGVQAKREKIEEFVNYVQNEIEKNK